MNNRNEDQERPTKVPTISAETESTLFNSSSSNSRISTSVLAKAIQGGVLSETLAKEGRHVRPVNSAIPSPVGDQRGYGGNYRREIWDGVKSIPGRSIVEAPSIGP